MVRRAVFVLASVLAMALGLGAVRGEVPHLTPEQLRQLATDIVVGPVISDSVEEFGRERRHTTVVRVERAERGGAEVGSAITVQWWTSELLPMTTGSRGHRADFVRRGRVVRVHAKDGKVLLPNGFAEAEPLFVSDRLLESRVAEEIAAAAKSAEQAQAYEEAERAYARLLELRDDPDDHMRLAQARVVQGRFLEAAEAVRPLVFSEPTASVDGKRTPREHARMIWIRALWESRDQNAYVEGIRELARHEDTPETWEYAHGVGRWCKDRELERDAAAALKRLGAAGRIRGR